MGDKTREDEMWCPECGAPIKKGFLTCTNCKLKVRLTRETNKEQAKKKPLRKRKEVEPAKDNGKNPLNIAGHTRYWNL